MPNMSSAIAHTKIVSLNVNGLNKESKQKLLHNYIIQHKIDILLIQEHNIKDDGKVDFLENHYDIIMNKSINLKGGTCILIKKHIGCEIERIEMSADSRITSAICKMQDRKIHILNIYAHASDNSEREYLFEHELPYYLRHNTSNTILGGDFNSVLSTNDVSTKDSNKISKALVKIIRNARMSDAWWIHNSHTEYTYVRQNYGSRIDRFYCNNRNNISQSEHLICSFSDHSAIAITVNINTNILIGKSYWKLNTKLLQDNEVKENFKVFWDYLRTRQYDFENINIWWEVNAKPQTKCFFYKARKAKEQ